MPKEQDRRDAQEARGRDVTRKVEDFARIRQAPADTAGRPELPVLPRRGLPAPRRADSAIPISASWRSASAAARRWRDGCASACSRSATWTSSRHLTFETFQTRGRKGAGRDCRPTRSNGAFNQARQYRAHTLQRLAAAAGRLSAAARPTWRRPSPTSPSAWACPPSS